MKRYCIVCSREIDPERIAKNPKKVRFCSDGCRSNDRHELAELQKRKRRSKVKHPTCGPTFPYQPLEDSSAHVQGVLEGVTQ